MKFKNGSDSGMHDLALNKYDAEFGSKSGKNKVNRTEVKNSRLNQNIEIVK
jgi:hypothetical protein